LHKDVSAYPLRGSEAAPDNTASSDTVIPKEIEATTSFGRLISDAYSGHQLCQVNEFQNEEIYLIKDLLRTSECSSLITESEAIGYGETNLLKIYRGNLRLIVYDTSLALKLWPRLSSYFPSTVEEGGVQYEVVGLNECWRCAKYFPKDRFAPHVDGFYANERLQLKSMFTINIYLNDCPIDSGGQTVFTMNGQQTSVQPLAGLCLAFRQPTTKRYLHEGTELLKGLKYLIRSDVMYRMKARRSILFCC